MSSTAHLLSVYFLPISKKVKLRPKVSNVIEKSNRVVYKEIGIICHACVYTLVGKIFINSSIVNLIVC